MARPLWHALPTIGLPRFTERVNRSHCADCGSASAQMDGRPASRFSRPTPLSSTSHVGGRRRGLAEGFRRCRLVLQDAGLDAGDAVILGPRSRRNEPGDAGEGDPRERLARMGTDEDVGDHRTASPYELEPGPLAVGLVGVPRADWGAGGCGKPPDPDTRIRVVLELPD